MYVCEFSIHRVAHATKKPDTDTDTQGGSVYTVSLMEMVQEV